MPRTATAPIRLAGHDGPAEPLRFNFTVHQLERIRPSERQTWVYDTTMPGLAMLVTPGGAQTFYFAKRIDGRYRRVKIGRFPVLAIEQARRRAKQLAGEVAFGHNPADARQQVRDAMTLGELFTLYVENHAKVHKRTWREDERQYNSHLKHLAGRRLDSITQSDVAKLHAKVGQSAPIAANRALALLRCMFNVGERFGYTGANPCSKVKRFAEHQRERFLDADEIGRFLDALEQEPSEIARDYLKVLLFTAQRRRNVASMCWDELDLRRAIWVIPGGKFKTGGAVEVPLVPQVTEIIERRQQANAERENPSEYVFPSHRVKSKLPYMDEPRGAFDRVCRAAGISGLTLHDLRRTIASWATMQGVPYPVVARMLGHKIQTVTGVYARFDMQALRDGFERTVNAMEQAAAMMNGSTAKPKRGKSKTASTKRKAGAA